MNCIDVKLGLRTMCAAVMCCGLALSNNSCQSAEPTNAMAAYMATPVNAFDLFIAHTNQILALRTEALFLDAVCTQMNLQVLASVKHNVPPNIQAEWESKPMLNFFSFDYDEQDDVFRARFSVLMNRNNPVYQAGLDEKGDAIRTKFARQLFAQANDITTEAVSSSARVVSRKAVKLHGAVAVAATMWDEVSDRTKVSIAWDIVPAVVVSGAAVPKTLADLAQAGIYTRHYNVTGHLQMFGYSEPGAIAVSYRDSRTQEEALDQMQMRVKE